MYDVLPCSAEGRVISCTKYMYARKFELSKTAMHQNAKCIIDSTHDSWSHLYCKMITICNL